MATKPVKSIRVERPSEADWTPQQKVNAQLEILDASLDAHPLEFMMEKIKGAGAISTLDATERIGRRVTVAGIRQTSHHSRTAKGEAMLFITLEDIDGTLDTILFRMSTAWPSQSSVQAPRCW